MGWFVEGAEDHEGYVASRVGVSVGLPDSVMVYRGPDGSYIASHSAQTGPLVIGWRGACSCGWWSARGWDRRPGEDDFAPDDVEAACVREWEDHIAPYPALGRVRMASNAAAVARDALGDAVAAARTVGLSWAEIGRAAGMTRQAARERWGGSENSALGRDEG